MNKTTKPNDPVFKLSGNVFYLGLVSFFTDISSEMTLTLLPLFLTNVLGVAVPIVGLIEGGAEATSSLLKIVSGWFSDRSGQRKPFTVFGYGLSSLVKPLLALAGSWPPVLAIRFADRLGKGVRTSPRDALIAESSPEGQRGRAFGWHRAADTSGALLGLVLATLVIWLTQRNDILMEQETFQHIVLWGAIPGFIAVAILIWKVHETGKPLPAAGLAAGLRGEGSLRRQLQDVGSGLWKFLIVMAIFTLGNSSDAFLLLRIQNVGLTVLQISMVLVVYNLLYALVALPAGILSDRIGRKNLLLAGWGVYALIYLGFARAGNGPTAVLLYITYGLYYAATDGVSRAFVSDLAVGRRQATAYGLYHAVVGLVALPASVLAGVLWTQLSPAAPFYTGAILAGVAALLLWLWVPAEQ